LRIISLSAYWLISYLYDAMICQLPRPDTKSDILSEKASVFFDLWIEEIENRTVPLNIQTKLHSHLHKSYGRPRKMTLRNQINKIN
jgi:hypothetical protein